MGNLSQPTTQLTNETRAIQLITTEFQTCKVSLDFALTQVELGFFEAAQREVSSIEKGAATIEHFLHDVESLEVHKQFSLELDQLRNELSSLRAKIPQ